MKKQVLKTREGNSDVYVLTTNADGCSMPDMQFKIVIGDSTGNSTKTFMSNLDDGGLYWECDVDGQLFDRAPKISLNLYGDWERDTFKQALKFFYDALSDTLSDDEYDVTGIGTSKSNKGIQRDNFNKYLNEVITVRNENGGKLKKISETARKYGVTCITKEDFFTLRLHEVPEYSYLCREYTDKVYEYVLTAKKPQKERGEIPYYVQETHTV